MEILQYDVVVLGSGIAGLTFALEAAAHNKVLVLCKAALQETNTAYAQGGIAAVLSTKDSFEQHVQDTLEAGAGLCDEAAVRFMVERAPESIQWLQAQQVKFDNAADGTIALGLEGGHLQNRIVHVKDHTGLSVQQALSQAALQHPNISILEHQLAIDLLTQTIADNNVCYGVQVLALETNTFKTIVANAVVLATGGSGQLYRHTTNPTIATGDGLAMAARAGAKITNMEFFQFHPTALYDPGSDDTFLISEALRGAGAELVLPTGELFMQQYHALGSLAPRDVVARAVYEQMQLHNSPRLYLDARELGATRLQFQFPSIYNRCRSIGIDPTIDLIPIVPAAHYQCGGVQTNLQGQTTIAGLYAIGEVACTGVHGANRLASNSLLEGVVFARAAAAHLSTTSQQQPLISYKNIVYQLPCQQYDTEINHLRKELQHLLWNHAGIVRTPHGLQGAMYKLDVLKYKLDRLNTFSAAAQEVRNLLTVAELILSAAGRRQKSIGGHFVRTSPEPVAIC